MLYQFTKKLLHISGQFYLHFLWSSSRNVSEIIETQRTEISSRKEELTETITKENKDDEPLKFTSLLENKEAFVNETVEFSCETSRRGIEVIWLKNNRPLSITEGRYQIVNRDCSYQLVIPSVTLDDSGEYSIQIDDLKSTAILTVTGQ